jgi:hypothetical protein
MVFLLENEESIERGTILVVPRFVCGRLVDKEKWGCFWRIGKNVLSLHIVHAEMA